jgi:uncharacterized protein YuzE
MKQGALRVWFDPEGDLLEINVGKPRRGFLKDAGNDVFIRVDEKGKVSGFAILNATKRTEKIREVKLPVKASFSRMKPQK